MPDSIDTYSISKHRHQFACWAAARAASVRQTKRGLCVRSVLESKLSEFCSISEPSDLPWNADTFEDWHTSFCESLRKELDRSFGQAAKLVAVYLKTRFVHEAWIANPKVACIYPPLDRLLLEKLSHHKNCQFDDFAWSEWDKGRFQKAIKEIKGAFCNNPLWMIEYYWPIYKNGPIASS